MFKDQTIHPWVFKKVKEYKTKAGLLNALQAIIAQAEEKYSELRASKSSDSVEIEPIE